MIDLVHNNRASLLQTLIELMAQCERCLAPIRLHLCQMLSGASCHWEYGGSATDDRNKLLWQKLQCLLPLRFLLSMGLWYCNRCVFPWPHPLFCSRLDVHQLFKYTKKRKPMINPSGYRVRRFVMHKMVIWGFPKKSPLIFHDPLFCFAYVCICTGSSNTRRSYGNQSSTLQVTGWGSLHCRNMFFGAPPQKKKSMTPSPVWLMFEIAQAFHIHEKLWKPLINPSSYRVRKSAMQKTVLRGSPPKKNICFFMTPSLVLLMFGIAQALHIHEKLWKPLINPSSCRVRGSAMQKTVLRGSPPKKTYVFPWPLPLFCSCLELHKLFTYTKNYANQSSTPQVAGWGGL